jgi:hypothetical protein
LFVVCFFSLRGNNKGRNIETLIQILKVRASKTRPKKDISGFTPEFGHQSLYIAFVESAKADFAALAPDFNPRAG